MINDADGTFERLNEAYADLKSEKDGLAGQIKQLEESLKTLKKELEEKYGSDDLEKLQQLLEEKEVENSRKSEKYEEHLVELNEKLAALEEAVDSDQPEGEEHDEEEESS